MLLVAFLAGPRLTAGIAALTVGSFVIASELHNNFGSQVADHHIAANALNLGWRGAVAVVVSYCLTSRAERIRELLESRRQLVTQSLRAEAQARRQLSYALHDGLAQDLLCVQQDLKAASRGRTEYLGRAQLALGDAVAQLRGQIFLLHPHQLEREGLQAALETVASRQVLSGGAHPAISVAPGVDGRDAELLFSVARELLINAARHAGATEVTLTVDRVGDDIVLACIDDGCGFSIPRRQRALEDGHLGLAACTERVEGVGGSFDIVSTPGRRDTDPRDGPGRDAARRRRRGAGGACDRAARDRHDLTGPPAAACPRSSKGPRNRAWITHQVRRVRSSAGARADLHLRETRGTPSDVRPSVGRKHQPPGLSRRPAGPGILRGPGPVAFEAAPQA